MLPAAQKHNFSWIFTLLLTIIFLYAKVNSIYILLAIGPLYFLVRNRKSYKELLLKIIISILPSIILVVSNFSVFDWFAKNDFLLLRSKLINYICSAYDDKTSSFIKLFLFNEKDKLSYEFYKKMISLSVIYLVVVGGIQTTIVKKGIFLIIKNKNIATALFLLFAMAYCYVLNFNISILRVLLYTVVRSLFRKRSCFECLGLCGILIAIVSPSEVLSFGYPLSFLCTTVVMLVQKIEFKNKVTKQISINILATGVTIPFVVAMGSSVSIFFFMTSMFLSGLMLLVFSWTLLTFFIKPFLIVHMFMFNSIDLIVDTLSKTNITIPIFLSGPIWGTIFLYGYFFTIIFIYKKHDKNICWSGRESFKIQNSNSNKT